MNALKHYLQNTQPYNDVSAEALERKRNKKNGVDTIGADQIQLLFPKNKASNPYG